MRTGLLLVTFLLPLLHAQTPPTAAQTYNNQLKGPESELVSLIEAVPTEAFSFKPKDGAFDKSRTFAQQATHIAYVNYTVAASLLQEKNPSTTTENENGPGGMSKDQVVKYVKDSFAYCHKALDKMTNANLMEMIPDAFDSKRKSTRMATANIMLWHTFDHYGQMVIYARMNNIVPPASR